MDTNEQTIVELRAALEREVAESQASAELASAHLDEISRINNELVNAQRDLANVAETARQDAAKVTISETRYRRLFESAQDGILILDATTGQIEDVNPYLCEVLGFAPDDFIGKQLWEIGTFRDIAANQDAFVTLQEQEYIRHDNLPLETKDGQSIAVEFISNAYSSGDKKVVQCNIRDNTERKQAEMSVRESQARFEILSRATNDIIWDWNLLANKVWWNEGIETHFGHNRETLEPGAESWKSRVHPDDRERVSNGIHAVIDSGQQPGRMNTAFSGPTDPMQQSLIVALLSSM